MEASDFNELLRHKGHNLVVTHYVEDEEGKSPEQVCVECHDCDRILFGVKRDDTFLTPSENAIDCIDSLVDIIWPDTRHPQENEWDSQTMTEVANRLGDYGFGPHAKTQKEGCNHILDPMTVRLAEGTTQTFDCTCVKCGTGGYFEFVDHTAEIMWLPEDE